jgi:enamine deaminase RidA (YjgF/YER057c/UK114 family)
MSPELSTPEDRLAKLGIHLPDAPTPFGAYVPAVQTGNLLFLSGMLARPLVTSRPPFCVSA